jgi:hypothetical protein
MYQATKILNFTLATPASELKWQFFFFNRRKAVSEAEEKWPLERYSTQHTAAPELKRLWL